MRQPNQVKTQAATAGKKKKAYEKSQLNSVNILKIMSPGGKLKIKRKT